MIKGMARLFIQIVKMRFRALIEYPGAFFAGIVAQWIGYGIEVFVLLMMVGRFGALMGWLPGEVVFGYAVWLLTYALGATLTFNLSRGFRQMGVSGELDEALIKPVPTLGYLIAANVNLGYISHVSLTLVVMGVAIARLGVAWGVWQWLWLTLLVLSGAVITGCLMLLFDLPALRLRGESPLGVFFWEGRRFSQYPLGIYPRPLQLVFSSLLPFGFVNYYPLLTLLGKTDGTPLWMASAAPLVALALLALTRYAFKRTIANYESAGT